MVNLSFLPHGQSLLLLSAVAVTLIAQSTAFQQPTFGRPKISLVGNSYTRTLSTTVINAAAVSVDSDDVDVLEQGINRRKLENGDKDIEKFLSLGAIGRMLPKESFDIDTKTSLAYFGIDLVAVVASLGFLGAVVKSDFYHSLPMVGQALTVAPLQVLCGFAMWCMWCIGHDGTYRK
jgi:hypothetical protein